jgi:hypothetical protein
MSEQLLRDENIFPNEQVIADALGEVMTAYQAFEQVLEEHFPSLSCEWRYYKDGKSWLCKGTEKKKTVFWLSVWDGFFKLSFYFTEKTRTGVMELEINEELKNQLQNATLIGKLLPLIIDVVAESQLSDVMAVLKYKAGLR